MNCALFVIFRAVHGRFKFLFDGSENGCGFAPKDTSIPIIETVLIDLSTYDCDELVTSSLNLLTQIYFFQEELFAIADQVLKLIIILRHAIFLLYSF